MTHFQLWQVSQCFYIFEVFQRPLTLGLLQMHRDTNCSCIMLQWVVYISLPTSKRACFAKRFGDRSRRGIAILFKSIAVKCRWESPDWRSFRKKIAFFEVSFWLSGLKNANAKRHVFWTQGTWTQSLAPRKASKSQEIIAMGFLNASVLERKSLNRNLSWGFPLGNLLRNAAF